jgi:methyl-galactoside transport system permease protein
MSTIPVMTPEKKGALLNSATMRRAVTITLSLLVILSCFLSYISYPVPAYEGYDSAAASAEAETAYQKDLAAYYDNVELKGTTQQNIDDVLQPAYDSANLKLKDLQGASPVDEAAVAAAQAEVDTAKAALTDGRKVLSGLQNLIAPVPVQDPVPADSKLLKYAGDLQTRDETRVQIEKKLQPDSDKAAARLETLKSAAKPDESAIQKAQAEADEALEALESAKTKLAKLESLTPPMNVSDVSLVDTRDEVVADHGISGFAIIGRKLSAANALGAVWTLIPGMILIAVLAVLSLMNAPLKIRKPIALFGVLLFCFSALRIETAGAKELGAIAKGYSFGPGYTLGIIASVLLLFSAFFEGKVFDFSVKSIQRFASDKAIYLVLLALVGAIAAVNPKFLTTSTFINIVQQSSTRLIIAMGMSFVIIGTGGVDLSACRVVGMTAVISASMLQNADYSRIFFPNLPQLPVIGPFVLAIFIALLFGLLNGVIVAKLNVPPFIATLATMVIVYGANSIYFNMPPNNSQPIGGLRDDFTYLGTGKVYGFIPIIVLIALVVCFLVWFMQNKTVFGKNVYAIGGNREAAKVSGINVPLTVIIIFALAAALIGMAGVLEAARTGGATNNYGVGYELDAIAACVVGGVSSSGGVGTVGGVVSGVFIFQVINYGLTFIGVDPYWQQIIKGIIIASAVALDIRKYVNKK